MALALASEELCDARVALRLILLADISADIPACVPPLPCPIVKAALDSHSTYCQRCQCDIVMRACVYVFSRHAMRCYILCALHVSEAVSVR